MKRFVGGSLSVVATKKGGNTRIFCGKCMESCRVEDGREIPWVIGRDLTNFLSRQSSVINSARLSANSVRRGEARQCRHRASVALRFEIALASACVARGDSVARSDHSVAFCFF